MTTANNVFPWELDEQEYKNRLRQSIGIEIANARAARNLGLRELSRISSVSPSNIARIERGEYTGGAEILDKICKSLGISLTLGHGRP